MKLPSFPWATQALLDQYILAFKKVIHHAADITQHRSSIK
jgi:hypothetical protein